MNGRLDYGKVALGVECALPFAIPRYGRARRFARWLLAALRRWA
jgi:hypothetical protein